MAKKKSCSKHQKDLYSLYKSSGKSLLNRIEKLERHIKKFPNDEQAKSALKKGLVEYRRKKPYKKVWTKPKRYLAQLYRKAGLNGHLALQ